MLFTKRIHDTFIIGHFNNATAIASICSFATHILPGNYTRLLTEAERLKRLPLSSRQQQQAETIFNKIREEKKAIPYSLQLQQIYFIELLHFIISTAQKKIPLSNSAN